MAITKQRTSALQTRNPPSNRPRVGRSHLRDDIVGGGFTVAFFVLVASFTVAFLWQRSVLEDLALDRLSAVSTAQQARIGEFIDSGANTATLIAADADVISSFDQQAASSPFQDSDLVASLGSYVAAQPDIEWASLYSAAGGLLLSVGEGARRVDSEYLMSASQGRAIGLVVAGETGSNLHVIAAPVETAGTVFGYVVVAQSMVDLEAMATNFTGLGETGETILAQILDDGSAQFIVPLRFDEDASLTRVVPAEARDVSIVAIAASDQIGGKYLDYRGEEVFASGSAIESADWALVVKIDRAEVMAPLTSFVRAGFVVLGLGSLLAAALAWLLARHIRRPIIEMKEAAMSVARGDRSIVVPNGRVDEIGDLAAAFNMMTAELNLLAGNLEGQVADRTAELELRNTELRELMQAKQTFLAGVSHEVRGPLTAMMGFLDLAGDDSLADSVDRGPMLEAAMKQADEVLILIEDLLAAARAESGTLRLATVRVNMGAQVAQVVEGLAPEQQDSLSVGDSAGAVVGDPARVRQIVRNLLTNAFRYGGSNIRVRFRADIDKISVMVEDDGPGIPLADRDHIFEAFGQATSGRDVAGSVGIGLHVSRQLAELMSGDLRYDYVDGWSTFCLDLPVFAE